MRPDWQDTIVALATPPGVGAIGVIRLSGDKSVAIVNALFPAKDLSAQPSHTLHIGYLKQAGEILDEVVVALYRAPRSYTGEEVVEISCHGSPYILQRVLTACIDGGARLARPGEFTQRAFLKGKLDLVQAEAVADLIASQTDAASKAALNAMRGGFSGRLRELREQLIRFSALIELELDFSQEDVEFADRTQLRNLVQELLAAVRPLLDSFRLGNAVRNGVSVAIIGKPNAGKSTLLNTLLNENRALVSDIPGTTRDSIEEVLNIDGILFRLIDTAGIREHTTDIIEKAGIERSLARMKEADLVIYLFEVQDDPEDIRRRQTELTDPARPVLWVANKADLLDEEKARRKWAGIEPLIFISARENRHIHLLRERMVDAVLQGRVQGENILVTNARHIEALQAVEKSLLDVQAGMDQSLPGDLLALDIRRCLQFLGEITGEITTEDQLDYIFSKFCIGK